ncbi:MAG: purine-binding chemotaxis protein CheW [Candidatus Lokiarchaeota archaeon]|nr:purine-binding chemotaxis protein CheW [Candidatus Lokiarchaeota archaeon]
MSQKQEYEGLDQVSILSFQIGWEEFCIDLYDVKEIIQAGLIRKLPKSLDYIDGIYNYRGEIIHVINLKKKLKLDQYVLYHSKHSSFEQDSSTTKRFIIILKLDNDLIGFYTDSILSIDHIDSTEIVGLSPIFQTSVAVEFIKGIIKFEERPRVILDLSKIFSDVDKFRIQQDLSSLT